VSAAGEASGLSERLGPRLFMFRVPADLGNHQGNDIRWKRGAFAQECLAYTGSVKYPVGDQNRRALVSKRLFLPIINGHVIVIRWSVPG
jgi:hypothetical protein